jgi:hypothetical protein
MGNFGMGNEECGMKNLELPMPHAEFASIRIPNSPHAAFRIRLIPHSEFVSFRIPNSPHSAFPILIRNS